MDGHVCMERAEVYELARRIAKEVATEEEKSAFDALGNCGCVTCERIWMSASAEK